jgi:hypothetical protein
MPAGVFTPLPEVAPGDPKNSTAGTFLPES